MTFGLSTPLGVIVCLTGALLLAPAFASNGHGGAHLAWQEDRPAKTIEDRLNGASKLAEAGQKGEARTLYEEAAELARTNGNMGLQSLALEGIGRLLADEAKYAEATQYIENALSLAETAGLHAAVSRLANALGAVLEQQGLYQEARSRYERSLQAAEAANDPLPKVRALLKLAKLKTFGMGWEANYHDAVEIARSVADKDLEAYITHSWGDILFEHGEYARASQKLARASALYREIGNQEDLARVYTSMGRLNRTHGQAAAAISLYEKALKIQQQVGDRLGVIQSLNAMGVAYDALNNLRRSGECYERAYALALETGSNRVIDFISANLAKSLLDRRQWARAAQILEGVLSRGLDPYPSMRHNRLSWAYEQLGRLGESLEQAQRAVEASPQDGEQRISALYRRAMIRLRMGDLSSAKTDALEHIRSIEQMRSKLVPLDYMKQGFAARTQAGYSLLIGLYHRTAEAEKALEVSELARARAFLDLMATRQAGLRPGEEAEIDPAPRHDMRTKTESLDSGRKQGATGVEPSAQKVEKGNEALVREGQSAGPELVSFAVAKPGGVAEIVAAAARLRSVILSYWVTPDALFVWSIHPGGKIGFRRVAVSEKRLAALVMATDPAVGSKHIRSGKSVPAEENAAGIPSFRKNWQELYRLLIQPVRKYLPPPGDRLTIVPHGPLMRLPFAALADAHGRYLLEDYPIHYIPAAALLEFTSEKANRSDRRRRFLLVADPAPLTGSKDTALPPLPGARQEAQKIAALLPAASVTILEGQRAGIRSVTAAMSKASVLHFATHGIARDDEPLGSYLALARDSSGSGKLTAEKIYGLNLHAELAVLSACRSGGEKMTGEGIAVLARAFFYAGAPSLVLSFWDVADETASRLLPDFYSAWLQGRRRIDALRAAQLRLLADLRAGRVQVQTPAGVFTLPEHPILWAGFGLLGEP